MIKLDNGEQDLNDLFYKESGKIIDPIKSIKYYLSLSDEERNSFFKELSLKKTTVLSGNIFLFFNVAKLS